MGLTKQYLRYAPSGTFNIIASSNCNCTHVALNGVSGRYIAVGACEHVIIWDMRIGQKAQVLLGEKFEATRLASSPTGNHLAVGYSNGTINVFDLTKADVVCIFAGHKSAITALCYDDLGHRLVSGSKDTEIILWDVVSETGLARFSGHKGLITDVSFINSKNCIVSSSKDTFVKFWDVETKHCFKTLGGHRSEVWGCKLMKNERYIVTGSIDQDLRVWKLNWLDDKESVDKLAKSLEIVKLEEGENEESEETVLQCPLVGTLIRGGRGRVVGLEANNEGTVLACFGKDSQLEFFSFCSDEEAKQRMEKRVKKQRKKLQKSLLNGEGESPEDGAPANVPDTLTLSDEVRRLSSVKLTAKIKATTLVVGHNNEVRCSVTLANNTVELHAFNSSVPNGEVICLKQVTIHGHQGDVRCVAISSDNLAILSASADSVKLWNSSSQISLRTISLKGSRPLSLCFVPGDRHALVGCADGSVLILDVGAGDVLEEIPAHSSDTWSVGLLPDQRGCFSGGGDKTVKFWQFELIDDPSGETKSKVLSLLHTRTLQLDEVVMAVRVSSNSKFLAVALLDSTVKIFFLDTFKFYLSLYGHKLPVLCMDISYDCNLIATGSADRSVKIWGLDFGDCHRSIFAHNDSVTGLQFVPGTHYFFTSSKDGKVKQWDGDSFNNIITLQGHIGECWDVSVGAAGLYAVSCGADRTVRVWKRTEEPLVLGDVDEADEGLSVAEKAPVPGLPNINMPSMRTIGSEKSAESIMECLQVIGEYHEAGGMSNAQLPLLMQAYKCNTPEDFLLETIKRIRSSDLEEALLLLPFKSACDIIKLLPSILERSDQTEIICRATIFLLKMHHASIVANNTLLKDIIQIQAKAMMRLNELRDTVGYNIHALMWMQRDIEATQGEILFSEAISDKKKKDKKRKAKQALKRPIIVVS